jgi:anti-anti-sigma factor
MQVTVSKKGVILFLALAGRLDASTPGAFETQLLSLIANGETHLVFDLAQVEYISSGALRVLLRAFKQVMYVNGRMAFHSVNARVKHSFEVAGLTMVFRLYDSREEAVASVLSTGMLPVNILKTFQQTL